MAAMRTFLFYFVFFYIIISEGTGAWSVDRRDLPAPAVSNQQDTSGWLLQKVASRPSGQRDLMTS
jgi:hypothetical protein